jgi:hypothetical protein
MIRAIADVSLRTPHIPLGIELREALRILGTLQVDVVEEVGSERSYRVDMPSFSVAVYPEGDRVRSVWYDDRAARETDAAKHQKVLAYLARYGAAANWEMRMDNGWMRYWLNPSDEAQMIYGVHMDVIRFNTYREAVDQ